MRVPPLSHRSVTLLRIHVTLTQNQHFYGLFKLGGGLKLGCFKLQGLKAGGKTEASRGLPTASSQDPGVGGSGGSQ